MAKRVLNCYVMSVQNSLPYRKTISSKMKKTWNNRSVVLQKDTEDTMDRVGEQWSVSENGNKKETYTYQEETVQVSRTQWWKRYWKIWYSHDRLRERGKTMHDIVILSKWSGKQDSGEIKKTKFINCREPWLPISWWVMTHKENYILQSISHNFFSKNKNFLSFLDPSLIVILLLFFCTKVLSKSLIK